MDNFNKPVLRNAAGLTPSAKATDLLRRIDEARQYANALSELWAAIIGEPVPSQKQFKLWLAQYGFEIVEAAIYVTAAWVNKHRQTLEECEASDALGHTKTQIDLIKYASGVMRNKKNAFSADEA